MLAVFLALFYPIFLTSIAVGPVFITISSIGLTYGLKYSLFAVIGVIFGNCLYLIIGALTANGIIQAIPPVVMSVVSFGATILLAKIAYGFFKKDVKKMKNNNMFDIGIKTIVKMFFITLSSPVVISGYVITFLTFANVLQKSFISGLFGGLCGAVLAYTLVALVSGIAGNKVKNLDEDKYFYVLSVLNKIAGTLLGGCAILLIVNGLKGLIKMVA